MQNDLSLERAALGIGGNRLGDLGASAGYANLPLGLAKVRWVQEALGGVADASFFCTPDFSVTRNRARWARGFAYGGAFRWSGDFMPLDLKPNACGMLVGGLSRRPSLSEVEDRLRASQGRTVTVDGQVIAWDFEESNHFFQIYEVEEGEEGLPPYVFILHGSGKEFRSKLYLDHPEFVFADRVVEMATPLGPLAVLKGDDARVYAEQFAEIEGFSQRRRVAFAEAVLGEFPVLSNVTHQGLSGLGTMLLGCVPSDTGLPTPLTLRQELDAFLVRARPEAPPFLPHGGGYALDVPGQDAILVRDGDRLSVRVSGPGLETTIEDIRAIPFSYRGMETARLTFSLPGIEMAARLSPRMRIFHDSVIAL